MTITIVQTSPFSGTPHQEHASGSVLSNPTALSAITQNDLVVGGGYSTGNGSSPFTPQNSYADDMDFGGSHALGGILIQSKIAGASENTTVSANAGISGTWVFSALEASGIQTASPLLSSTTAERSSAGTSLAITSPSIPANTYVDVLAVLEVLTGGTPGGTGDLTITGWTVVYSALEGIALAYQIITTPSGTVSVTPSWTNSLFASAGLTIYKGLAVATYPGEVITI